MAREDPHSHADSQQPRARHLKLRLRVDFAARRLEGEAALELTSPAAGILDLDSKALEILEASTGSGASVPFEVGPDEPILGSRLRLTLPPGTREVRLRYRTSPDAPALQWLSPEQTEGGRHPFLFSQCQPIHARSLVPLQDTARRRLTYEAELEVPEPLGAVMSAGPAGEGPGSRPGTRVCRFRMPQPIPPYLLALAVGRLESRELGPRSRVFAEPETVEKAAHEFAETEAMIARAEELFGPYDWDRYDMLVLPPSFPYGGMENPRMTFLTPTLLAGDRSLVDVVVHELAHSWTGNLVTNADMEHFWLNEGFTVWAERRLLEALHGEEATVLAWAIGEKALEESLARFGPGSPLTRLRTKLAGTDPDDAFSSVPYEKGARFVTLLERTAGRERFDRFMRDYMARFRFTSITTEEFLAFLEGELPGLASRVGAHEWLYEPGLPHNAPVVPLPASRRPRDAGPGPGGGRAAGRLRDRRLEPRRDARLSPEPAPRDRVGGLRLARLGPGPDGPRQPRDPGRVADSRRGVRLRARLCTPARGAPAGGPDEVPAAPVRGDGSPPAHTRARPGDLRRRRAAIPRAVPSRGRLRPREVPRRVRILTPRAP